MIKNVEIKAVQNALNIIRVMCVVTVISFMGLAATCLIMGGDLRYAAMAVVTYFAYDACRTAGGNAKKELAKLVGEQ